MVTYIEETEQIEEEVIEIIQSDNWELPVCNLGKNKYTWRPYTACLPYHIFEGPLMTVRTHGINLHKDMLIGIHGPRGACKTISLSYLIAKKMRMGQQAWCNWPISFYVVEPTCWDTCEKRKCENCSIGHKTYYENYPLNMDKLYTFNTEISEGVVGLTELQYYAEARTSGRGQNRFLSYQLMQLRKSALSFFYDVQNPRWADNRFAWSDDVKIFARDVAKMNYDYASVGREIQEGELSHWQIRDISGVLTGIEFEISHQEHGAYQFDAYHFWHIYPTQWKIDVYDAVYSMKQKSDKADKDAAIGRAMALAINSFLEDNILEVESSEMWARASALSGMTVNPTQGGAFLASYGVRSKQSGRAAIRGKYIYDLSVLIPELNDEK